MSQEKTYEEALNEIEEITRKLELGDIPLEQSIELYKKAMELSAFCVKKLEGAEKEIILLQKSAQGVEEMTFEGQA